MAITLVEPLDSADAAAAISLADVETRPRLSDMQRQAMAKHLLLILRAYEMPRALLAAAWGRQRYNHAIGEFLAKVDSKCFERKRIWRRLDRLRATGDTSGFAALRTRWLDPSHEQPWLC